MILLDTHTLIWLDCNDSALGRTSRDMIKQACRDGGVSVSAISFWEAAMLTQRGRISLPVAANVWRMELLNSGIQELEIDGRIAIMATTLENMHRDPADRFIVATAQIQSATLVTADEKILAWAGNVKCHDARS